MGKNTPKMKWPCFIWGATRHLIQSKLERCFPSFFLFFFWGGVGNSLLFFFASGRSKTIRDMPEVSVPIVPWFAHTTENAIIPVALPGVGRREQR